MQKIKNRGFGLIEIVIGSAILVAVVLAAGSAYTTYMKYAFANERNIQISYLLEEGLEAVTFLRDRGWTANIAPLSTATTYYLTWNGSYWATTTSAQYIDGEFFRSINIADVRRDGNDQIAVSGTVDTNTKQVTATVSFRQNNATTTKSISTYIANIYNN